ncbi:hypothetical protein CHS0354_025173 [Potamilus streckersoni]|uniref:Uncharacterized protein n=1 Tax=Potamilus streckersoni TaxID=2493646 RepID=A0AAE0VJR0_9BIVA|nr:hypothetical protein CHS0354_025173 [Potamilus streckersoni]
MQTQPIPCPIPKYHGHQHLSPVQQQNSVPTIISARKDTKCSVQQEVFLLQQRQENIPFPCLHELNINHKSNSSNNNYCKAKVPSPLQPGKKTAPNKQQSTTRFWAALTDYLSNKAEVWKMRVLLENG